jgi:redox-sensitive bicupin YhaK (pirin superfamily)
LNDDIVEAGMGFGTHPHDNMEIITIPLTGQLEHADNTGHQEVILPGEVQVMSAGTGILHSEYNPSNKEDVNLLQIWIFPKLRNIKPRYAQKLFPIEGRINQFQVVASPEEEGEALWINQDAYISRIDFDKDITTRYDIKHKGNGVYLFVVEGSIITAEENLGRRDAIGIWESDTIGIKATKGSSLVLFEVPMV